MGCGERTGLPAYGGGRVRWRGWVLFAITGSAVALGWRGDWAAAFVAAACVLVPVAAWVGGEFATTRAALRESVQPAAGRHRRRRGVRDALVAAITAAAKVPLP